MALLADGWHMGTHVAALAMAGHRLRAGTALVADSRFTFGTWKIEVLGAFSSALVLAIVALAMAIESSLRLVNPHPIAFGSALAVAVVGLVVNVVSAFVLAGHDHGHDHDHDHDHGRPATTMTTITIMTTTTTSITTMTMTTATHIAAIAMPGMAMATSTCAPPTCTCWRTPSPRCSPSWRSPPGWWPAGYGWTR